MKLPSKVLAALNTQIKNELQSHYVYLAMAAHFETTAYKGFGAWMRVQSQEEYGHAMKLFDYLRSRNAPIELQTLEAPKNGFGPRPIAIFQASLEQEETVTEQINDLYELAQKEKDYATLQFLTWFLQEQVEEENTVSDFIDRLKLAGNDPAGLLRLDDEAKRRAMAGPGK
jgi:ferritin